MPQKLPLSKRAVVCLLALACAVAGALISHPIGASAATGPDVVVIQTDDQVLSDLYAVYVNTEGAIGG